MTPALWLLLVLQLKGWLRYFLRNLRTIKGALLALVGGGVMLFWLSSLLLMPPPPEGIEPGKLLAFGPALLLMYCLLNVVQATGERVIYFAPAEVNFLFSGPFSPRQILAYKILNMALLGVPTTLFMTLVFRYYAASFLSAYVGLYLMFFFMSLLTLALNLIGITIGAHLYTRLRKVVLGAVLVLAAGLLWHLGALHWREFRFSDVQELLETSETWHRVSWPLRTFFEAFLAERIWPDLVIWAGLGSLVDLALLGVVLILPANYLETAAVSSARTFARLQKLRSGGVLAVDEGGSQKKRFRLPELPYWGGIGPILWRQMTAAMRGLNRLVVLFVIFGLCFGAPLFGTLRDPEKIPMLAMAVMFTLWMTIMLTALVPFDFRGDLDRMAVLKSLPIVPWRLAVGQLLTPTLLVSGAQWLVLAGILTAALAGLGSSNAAEMRLVAVGTGVAAVFVLPFNFLLFGLENLLFLLFPARVLANQPGDFQALGRNVLFGLAKLFSLLLVFGMAAVAAVVVSFVSQKPELGVATAWVVLLFSAIMTIPLVTLAFLRFDVGRDTPP